MDRVEKLQELLQDTPDDPFLKHALALECIKAGDEKSARRLFEEVLAHDASYIGSYYHLAKLLERAGETAMAIGWYEKGMVAAKAAGNNHAFNELQAGYDDLVD